jgi:RNA polymerase sigma-70 factor (ECF subfamily)
MELNLSAGSSDDIGDLASLAAQNNDLDAFNHLVLKLQDSVYGLAYYILSNAADAEDATQAAFLSAFLHIRSYRGGSFKAWIMRIVTNICYDKLRQQKRNTDLSIDDEQIFGESIYDRMPDPSAPFPEEEAQQADMIDSLRDCLDRLPEDYRTVTLLVDIDGMDYKEASEVISRPVGTVKSRVARARMHLRNCMIDLTKSA